MQGQAAKHTNPRKRSRDLFRFRWLLEESSATSKRHPRKEGVYTSDWSSFYQYLTKLQAFSKPRCYTFWRRNGNCFPACLHDTHSTDARVPDRQTGLTGRD